MEWSSIPGANNYIVRKNGTFLATVGNTLSFVDTNAADGDSWLVRSRLNGVTTNTDCTVDGNPPPPPVVGCDVAVNGGQVTLTWDAFNGENDNYVVRINGAFDVSTINRSVAGAMACWIRAGKSSPSPGATPPLSTT